YIDSELNVPFLRHLVEELLPDIRSRFGADTTFSICGHSSGGFGALNAASLHPDLFPRVASFAGDMHFTLTHMDMVRDFTSDLRRGNFGPNLASCLKMKATPYVLGLCAAYSPRLSNRKWKVDFPVNPESGEFDAAVWAKWLSHDPVEWAAKRVRKLARLQRILLSAGDADQFGLHLGAATFAHRLKNLGVTCELEIFANNHSLLHRQLESALVGLLC
ncbi:MAG: hypothetical protein HQL31_03785, partial [Planctomycetes bacterium]|nr:hypothetical protein [Planctomycetota bacterium]